MARKLITTAGRKQVIGRPILYKTTREFLLKFGLKDVSELPSIEEFEKMAGQLAEQEEIALPEHEQAEQPEEQESSENTETPETTKERMESEGEASATDPVADEAIVDGSFSGLPPAYAAAPDDPSAAEAEIQESGSSESSE
jgi:segregation and condensation protein B